MAYSPESNIGRTVEQSTPARGGRHAVGPGDGRHAEAHRWSRAVDGVLLRDVSVGERVDPFDVVMAVDEELVLALAAARSVDPREIGVTPSLLVGWWR